MKLKFKFRDGDLTSPAKVDHNIYDPNLDTAESLDVLNGHLDHRNIDFSDGSPLPLSAFRRGSLFRGKMSGSTLNSDYYKKLFNYRDTGHWNTFSDDDPEEIQPIPGCGIELYTPSSGMLLLTWQLSYSSDLDNKMSVEREVSYSSEGREKFSVPPAKPEVFTEGQDSKIRASRAFVTLMGATDESNLAEIGYRQYLPESIRSGYGLDPQRVLGSGRVWSGHHMVQATEQTWYRYAIGILSTANMSRVRIRNFKYLFFPNATATLSNISTSDL